MRRAGWLLCIAVAGFVVAGASAQQTDGEHPPVGSVKGHVICGDTQRPARFAEVLLLRKPEPESPADATDARPATVEVRRKETVLLANGRSLLDGSYEIRDVPPGDYYVLVKLTGYIGPISTVETEGDTDNLDKVLAGVPMVHIVADRSSTADVTLRRGGTVKGAVRFDDGSPLGGALVKVETVAGVDPSRSTYALDMIGNRLDQGTTDDEGNYRISGLPPGKYRMRVDVEILGGLRVTQFGGSGSNQYGQSARSSVAMHLSVYSPGTLRQSKATVFEIKGDERLSGADAKVDLGGLHSVKGRATTAEPRCELIMGFANVNDAQETEFNRTTDVQPDGSFRIEYVPEGTYTLMVSAACDPQPDKAGVSKQNYLRQLRSAKVAVIVTDRDVDVDEIPLTEFRGNSNH
jgi:hypothetical protein